MESKDRRFVVKSYDYNHKYKLNGKNYNRNEAIDIILDVLDVKAMTINELSKMFKINGQPMLNLIKVMRENNLIKNTKLRRNGNYLFKSYNDCLLSTLLYPVDKIVKLFKIKGTLTRSSEQGTSKHSNSSHYNINYNNSHYNSVYWGD